MLAISRNQTKKYNNCIFVLLLALSLAGCGGGGDNAGVVINVTEQSATITGSYSFTSTNTAKSIHQTPSGTGIQKNIALPDGTIAIELYNLEGVLIESGKALLNNTFSLIIPNSKLNDTKKNNSYYPILTIRDTKTGFAVKTIISTISPNDRISQTVNLQTLVNTKLLEIEISQYKKIEQANFDAKNFSLGIKGNTVTGDILSTNQEIRSLFEPSNLKVDPAFITNISSETLPIIAPLLALTEEISKNKANLSAQLQENNLTDYILNEMINCSIDNTSCQSFTDPLFEQTAGKDNLRQITEMIKYENEKNITATQLNNKQTTISDIFNAASNSLRQAVEQHKNSNKLQNKLLILGKLLNSAVNGWIESDSHPDLQALKTEIESMIKFIGNTLAGDLTTEQQINSVILNICNWFKDNNINTALLTTLCVEAIRLERHVGAKLIPLYTCISLLSNNISSDESEAHQNLAIEKITAILHAMEITKNYHHKEQAFREMNLLIEKAHPLSSDISKKIFNPPQISLITPFITQVQNKDYFDEKITINFQVNKHNFQGLFNLEPAYRIGETGNWLKMTLDTMPTSTKTYADTTGLNYPDKYHIIWDSVADLERTSNNVVYIKLTPADIFASGESAISEHFKVFNNRAPILMNAAQTFYYLDSEQERQHTNNTNKIYERLSNDDDEQTIIGLSAENTTDPDDDQLSFLWEQIAGPAVNFNQPENNIFVEFSAPIIDKNTELQFRLTATDQKGLSSQDTYSLNILFRNKRPIAHIAGQGKINDIYIGDTITLDGGQSYDPDEHLISYEWFSLQPEIIATSSIIGTHTAMPTIKIPFHTELYNKEKIVSFQLIASDHHTDSLSSMAIVSFLVHTPLPKAIITDEENKKYNVYDTIILNGEKSTNYQQKPLIYEWRSLDAEIPTSTIYFSNRDQAEVKVPNTPYFRSEQQSRTMSFELKVCDEEMRELCHNTTERFTVEFQNRPPSVSAGPDFSVKYVDPDNTFPKFTITGWAEDFYNRPMKYEWSLIPPYVNGFDPINDIVQNEDSPIVTITTPKIGSEDGDIKLNFQLKASSLEGGELSTYATDSVTITIEYINKNYPTIEIANPIEYIPESSDGWSYRGFKLDGSKSSIKTSDGILDFTNLDFSWTQLSGFSIDLGDSTSPIINVTAPNVKPGSEPLELEFLLQASTKGSENSASARKTVFVSYVNFWPANITASSEQNTYTEVNPLDSSPNTVYLSGMYEDPDERDGQTVNVLWEQITPNSPVVDIKDNHKLEAWFKTPAVTANTKFTFRFYVLDGDMKDPQKRAIENALYDDITMDIEYVNTAPVIKNISVSPSPSLTEGATFTISGNVNDRETPDDLIIKLYEIPTRGEKQLLKTVESQKTISYTTNTPKDVERNDRYKSTNYQLEVCDQDKNDTYQKGLCTENQVTITRSFVNQSPIAIITEPTKNTVEENNRENVIDEAFPYAIELNARESYDPDSDKISSYQWTILNMTNIEDYTYAILHKPTSYPDYQRQFIPKDVCKNTDLQVKLTVLDQDGVVSTPVTTKLGILFKNRPPEITEGIHYSVSSNKKTIYLTARAQDPDLESGNTSLRCTDTLKYTWSLTDENGVRLSSEKLNNQGCLFLSNESINSVCINRHKVIDTTNRGLKSSTVSYVITNNALNTDNMQNIYIELVVHDRENESGAYAKITTTLTNLSFSRNIIPAMGKVENLAKDKPELEFFPYQRNLDIPQKLHNMTSISADNLFITIDDEEEKPELHYLSAISFPAKFRKGELYNNEYRILLENNLFWQIKPETLFTNPNIQTDIADFYSKDDTLFILSLQGQLDKISPNNHHILNSLPQAHKILPFPQNHVFVLDQNKKLYAVENPTGLTQFVADHVVNMKKCHDTDYLLIIKSTEMELLHTNIPFARQKLWSIAVDDAACNEKEIILSQQQQLYKDSLIGSGIEQISPRVLQKPIAIEATKHAFLVMENKNLYKIQSDSMESWQQLEQLFIPPQVMDLANRNNSTIILYSDFFMQKQLTDNYQVWTNPTIFENYLIDESNIYAQAENQLYLLKDNNWELKNTDLPHCTTAGLIAHNKFFCPQKNKLITIDINTEPQKIETILLTAQELKRGAANTVLLRNQNVDLIINTEFLSIVKTAPANSVALNCQTKEFDISPVLDDTANDTAKILYYTDDKVITLDNIGLAVADTLMPQNLQYFYYLPNDEQNIKILDRIESLSIISQKQAVLLQNPCIFID